VNLLALPWVEIALACCAAGAVIVSFFQDSARISRGGLAFSGFALAAAVLGGVSAHAGFTPEETAPFSLQERFLGTQWLVMDSINAPLLPMAALLHFLTALSTTRTKLPRFSFSLSLASEALTLATLSSRQSTLLIALLAAGAILPWVELANRGKPQRVYVVHMAAFCILLVAGWAVMETGWAGRESAWATVPIAAAVLIRCHTIPAHCWLTDWLEHASFGNGMLYVSPLAGVYAAIRLVLPTAPEWLQQVIGGVAMATAVYAAALATIQRDARRFYAYLFLSFSSLVLFGLQLDSPISLTGSLALWFSVGMSLGGFGLTLRAMEGRFGRLSLAEFHGLYNHSPMLAVCFLLAGLASVGFPGTLGFVSVEVLLHGAMEEHPLLGLAMVAATALNGIAVVRAWLLIFTGARHVSTVSMRATPNERFAVLLIVALLFLGGMVPEPGIISRYHAALEVTAMRRGLHEPVASPPSAFEGSRVSGRNMRARERHVSP
jgi:NADH-quinone oxidoreductase subunit M